MRVSGGHKKLEEKKEKGKSIQQEIKSLLSTRGAIPIADELFRMNNERAMYFYEAILTTGHFYRH